MARRPYHPRGELVEGYAVSDHPLYTTHNQMIARCTNPRTHSYKNYGGRGVRVCKRWLDFRNFVVDMGPKPSPKHTLERVNNDGDYEPGNCVWATRTQQCLNRRRFSNNTSGETGVLKTSAGWHARYDHEGQRYAIGWFKRKSDAVWARVTFVDLFHIDRPAALELIRDRVRSNSSTGHRGVTPCEDGYIARCTINGERHYVGYFKELNDAVRAREDFIASRTGRVAGRVGSARDARKHK
jgi:hypothetical protein